MISGALFVILLVHTSQAKPYWYLRYNTYETGMMKPQGNGGMMRQPVEMMTSNGGDSNQMMEMAPPMMSNGGMSQMMLERDSSTMDKDSMMMPHQEEMMPKQEAPMSMPGPMPTMVQMETKSMGSDSQSQSGRRNYILFYLVPAKNQQRQQNGQEATMMYLPKQQVEMMSGMNGQTMSGMNGQMMMNGHSEESNADVMSPMNGGVNEVPTDASMTVSKTDMDTMMMSYGNGQAMNGMTMGNGNNGNGHAVNGMTMGNGNNGNGHAMNGMAMGNGDSGIAAAMNGMTMGNGDNGMAAAMNGDQSMDSDSSNGYQDAHSYFQMHLEKYHPRPAPTCSAMGQYLRDPEDKCQFLWCVNISASEDGQQASIEPSKFRCPKGTAVSEDFSDNDGQESPCSIFDESC